MTTRLCKELLLRQGRAYAIEVRSDLRNAVQDLLRNPQRLTLSESLCRHADVLRALRYRGITVTLEREEGYKQCVGIKHVRSVGEAKYVYDIRAVRFCKI